MKMFSRVRIKGITDESDMDLNGRTGELSPRFFSDKKNVFGEVGVWLDEPCDGTRMANVLKKEIEKES